MIGPETKVLAVPSRESDHDDADDVIVRAALTEPAAFALLYERYYDRVYRYCRARTPTHEDSADLAQQVFVQAFHNLHRFRPRGNSFVAWLFRIAHNLAVDASRKRRRQTISWENVPDLVAQGSDPEEAAVRTDQLDRLRGVINALPPEQQELIVLRFAVGLSVSEIAAVIGKSLSATQMRLSRTLHKIRRDY